MKCTDMGKKGEDLAVSYLINSGYDILDRNYHSRYGEIDIIAGKDNVIVFVEVKLRKSCAFGNPCEFVNKTKLSKLEKTLQIWLSENNADDKELRFDIIEETGIAGGYDIGINHIVNAYERF